MLQQKTSFLQTYKWLLVPAIPLLLFILLTVFLFIQSASPNKPLPQELATPTSVPQNKPTSSQIVLPQNNGENHDEELRLRPGLQNVEPLLDGTTRYTFASSNPTRPNIFITANNIIIFERLVRSQDESIQAGVFVQNHGKPLRIIKGSRFYGENARVAIFEQSGKAIIYDPDTSNVLEQHSFLPMSSDDYIQRYGADIVDPSAVVSETIPENSAPRD